MEPTWHLLAFVGLSVSALLLVDHLWSRYVERRARRRRLEARIDELKREARRRQAERPTLNTRGRAP
jgi:hypothetical protein